MIKLVTGSTGTEHVTAADDGALHAALGGSGLVVFDTGSKFGAVMTDATNIRISDGEGMIDGRHFRIAPGDTEELSMSAGVAGYTRKDLVALHYVNSGGLESLTLEVIEGAFGTGTVSDPSYKTGSILAGATEVYVPLYRLTRSGINVPSVEQLFEIGADTTIPGAVEGSLLVVDANGKIVPSAKTVAKLGTGVSYTLDGTTLYINTL